MLVSTSIGLERHGGFWNRANIAGVKDLHLTLSYFVQGFSILVIQMVINAPFVCFFTEAKSLMSFCLLNSVYLTCGVFGITFGILTSNLMGIKASLHLNNGLLFASLYTCGIYWPVEGQASLLKLFSFISPYSNSASAARQIAFKNASIDSREVQIGFTVLFGWILVISVLTLLISKRNKKGVS
jgi:ABC-type multidrug transport system permease subunit